MRFRLIFLAAACVLAGCAAPAQEKSPLPTEDDRVPERAPKQTGRTSLPSSPIPGQPASEASAKEARSFMFAHDDRVLYKLEAGGAALEEVAPLSCLKDDERVVDMAVSGSGAAYATTWGTKSTYSRFLTFDPLTADCTVVAESTTRSYPNSLSFVPKGTVDPDADALVGYENTDQGTRYVRIDLATGAISDIGWLQVDLVATRLECSGDIVALDGGKAYLTVRPLDGVGSDELVEVDPRTGKLLREIGPTGFEKLWGLAYWQGKAYGFSGTGQVLEIDLATGKGTAMTLGGVPKSFLGAAVSTVAPK